MRLKPALLCLLLLALAACGDATLISNPRLNELGPFSTVITWDTDRPLQGSILYGEGSLQEKQAAENQAQIKHRLAIGGLKPATRYSYRIEPGGFTGSFRTAPDDEGAFDLIVLDAAASECSGPGAEPGDPDLLILINDCSGPLAQRPHAIYTLRLPLPAAKARAIDYGAWTIVLAGSAEAATKVKIDRAQQRIVVLPDLPEQAPPKLNNTLILSGRGALRKGVRSLWSDGARIEIDAYEVAAVELGQDQLERRVLIKAPPETRKTCLYCDRLLERGRYEESLAWYREFAAGNRKRYEIEDALYQIAAIQDERLFDYTAAIAAYRDLLAHYPQSRRAPLAEYRLRYLESHADSDFAPLSAFERAKAGLVATDPRPAAAQVRAMLEQYPDAAVAEEAEFWLAHLLEQIDERQARETYARLIQQHPQGEHAPLAAMAIGDLHYGNKRYREAIAAYQDALAIAPPEQRISLDEKLRKCSRNIQRERLRYAAWALLIVWAAASLILGARPARRDWNHAIAVLLLLAAAAGVCLGLTWERSQALFPVLCGLIAAIVLAVLWNASLQTRLGRRWGWLLLHIVSVALAATFLVLYHFHYLYLFGV